MFCRNCGASIPDGYNVCPSCGNVQQEVNQAGAASSYPYQQPEQPQYQQPQQGYQQPYQGYQQPQQGYQQPYQGYQQPMMGSNGFVAQPGYVPGTTGFQYTPDQSAAPQAAPAPGGLMTPGAPAGPQNGPQIAIPPAPPAASTVVPNVTAPPIFGDAFKMFPKFFKNPSGANREALDGHLSFGASMILGGLYFLIKGGPLKALPAFGFGALAALLFCGIRVGGAFLISLIAKNPEVNFKKVLGAVCVDTIPLDCILLVMGLFQFISVYCAVIFMLIYLGVVLFQNAELYQKLVKNSGENKIFWMNIVLIASYAILIMLLFIIYRNIPYSAVRW